MVENQYDIDVMQKEIALIPSVIKKAILDDGGHIHSLAKSIVDTGISSIWLTGCGDSAFAGLAAALSFNKNAQIPTQGIHALELARYKVRYLPEKSLVIALSFSGKVGRTTEAVINARRFGHRTVALTNAPEGQLGSAASEILPISVPTLGFSPGTSTYVGMLATLLCLSAEIALIKGNPAPRAELEGLTSLAAETLELSRLSSPKVAKKLFEHTWIAFIGAGPNEATAKFGAAKLFEGPQRVGIATNIEEWAHEEYFVSETGTPVVVIAPSGASFDRAEEIISELNFIGAIPIIISDQDWGAIDFHLRIAIGAPEELSPILTCLPLALVGFHLAQISGKQSYNFKNEATRIEHYETIHRATVGEPA